MDKAKLEGYLGVLILMLLGIFLVAVITLVKINHLTISPIPLPTTSHAIQWEKVRPAPMEEW